MHGILFIVLFIAYHLFIAFCFYRIGQANGRAKENKAWVLAQEKQTELLIESALGMKRLMNETLETYRERARKIIEPSIRQVQDDPDYRWIK